MAHPDADKILSGLNDIVKVLEEYRRKPHAFEIYAEESTRLIKIVRQVARMIRAVRPPIKLGPELTNEALALMLAKAARECDSALLDIAALRLGRKSEARS